MPEINERTLVADHKLQEAIIAAVTPFYRELGPVDGVSSNAVRIFHQWATATTAINDHYKFLGGAPGNELSHNAEFGANDGFFKKYTNGVIYWHPATGAHYVYGAILGKYLALGAEAGFLGYPLTDETGTPDKIGRYNHFQAGSIYWTPKN